MKKVLTALACLGLFGCGGGSGGSFGQPIDQNSGFEECSPEDQKSWVLSNMQDYYLFYDTALFEEGKRFGFGMRIRRTDDQKLYFSLIEPLSPLGQENVERGDELLAINGVTTANFTSDFISAAFGGEDEAIDLTLSIRERNSTMERTVTVTKALYDVQTVLDAKVLTENNHRIGYLNFLTFLETSEAELDNAFAVFKSENVDELVLDVRHNLGGRISVAEQLGSLIAGNVLEGRAFTRVNYNNKYAFQNDAYPFEVRANSLNLPRVYVLTSPDTCSASEMVINSLRPFIDVITIGDASCGKPYGTRARNKCGKSMNALEVEFANDVNVGGYYNGIPADCPVTEDLSEPLGHPSENLLRSALHHVSHSSCLTGFATAQAPTPGNSGEPALLTDARFKSGHRPAFVKPVQGPELMNPSYDEIRTLLAQ